MKHLIALSLLSALGVFAVPGGLQAEDQPPAQEKEGAEVAVERKLTPGEAAEVLAFYVGTWEGVFKREGVAGPGEEIRRVLDWKEKGQSVSGTSEMSRGGTVSKAAYSLEYDADRGVFISRTTGEGEPERSWRRRYDPEIRTFYETMIAPKQPPGTEVKRVLHLVGDDRFRWKIEAVENGRVIPVGEGKARRLEPVREGPSRSELIRAHLDKFASDDRKAKEEALEYFRAIDKSFGNEVPLFTSLLQDERYQVRALSAYALGKTGAPAVGSIPGVEKLLTDSSATVQKYASRALERLKSSRLTAEEAAKVLAQHIGEWEGKGQVEDQRLVPVSFENKQVIRWKEKGKSLEGTFNISTGGVQRQEGTFENEYDPVSGLFVLRNDVGQPAGTLRIVATRRYDPATRTFYTVSFFPGQPENVETKHKYSLIGSDRISMRFENYEDGELVSTMDRESRRKSASLEPAKKLTAGEAANLMALAIGEWEFKGEQRVEGKAPEALDFVDKHRWKKKGKSFQVLRVNVRTGRLNDRSFEQEYDPVSGQFFLRTIVDGKVVETFRREYDPANRTWTDTVISPELPPGKRLEGLLVNVNEDKRTLSYKGYSDGRLVWSWQVEGNRKPASKKLTPEEAADALALLIGEWEGKGQRKDKNSDWVPVSIELKDAIRWKEKGKSIEGTFQIVVGGKEEPARAYEKAYDPASGLFILRGGVAGSELKLIEHRRYDPATRTFQTISFFPEREGLERKFKFSITESGRISYIFEMYDDGKLWGEQKLDAMRMERKRDIRSVKIGILHSLTGTMATHETSLKDVVLMAAEEINAKGGVLGKKVEPVVVDPASNWPLFAEKAKELINTHKVAVTFGCWTSVSRKVCLPVFEEYNQLLFYPVQYEGEEQSHNVFYTGATPNQQIVPAADYLLGKGFRKFYLIGTDYVSPRTANKVLKAYLKLKGVPDENVRDEYTPFYHQNYQNLIGKVKAFAAGGKACVISTLYFNSVVPFSREFVRQGLTLAHCPIMDLGDGVTEDGLRTIDVLPLVGHLAVRNYFQSIDTRANAAFVKNFKSYCARNILPGGSDRVTDDPIEAAYFGVYVWKAAVEKAGSFDVDKVRQAIYGLEFDAPGGKKSMHPKNQHTLKPVYIGEILKDGQFKIVYQSKGLFSPDSYSSYLWPNGAFPVPTGGPK